MTTPQRPPNNDTDVLHTDNDPDADLTPSQWRVVHSAFLAENGPPPRQKRIVVTEVLVETVAERHEGERWVTWVANREPSRPIAIGHMLSITKNDGTIGQGKVARYEKFTRHWVTLYLTRGREGLRVRVPLSWTHLSALEGYAYILLYHALSPSPAPYGLQDNLLYLSDQDQIPYELVTTPGGTVRLLIKSLFRQQKPEQSREAVDPNEMMTKEMILPEEAKKERTFS
ncbi:hypothetical protein EVJ58_g9638 [Rhodofomes roseus]|uniref:Uncharacterized protein n=1 Tax=Rhodofomes roseus TaxID=34475 RepID=A0A4Y9XS11_9APHY|nr:hypothetical protein EVJ58_g9638 [Rhodofomes roseus]